MMIVAIDPGLTGAAAILDHNGLREIFDVPTMKIPGICPTAMVQNKVDARALCKLLLTHCPAGTAPHVVIEAVGAMGGKNNSVQTQGSLLRSLGAIEAVVECLRWPVTYVNAQTWKRSFGLIDGEKKTATQRKAQALEVARRLYPGCNAIPLAKHHNRAEALLMAHHHRMLNA